MKLLVASHLNNVVDTIHYKLIRISQHDMRLAKKNGTFYFNQWHVMLTETKAARLYVDRSIRYDRKEKK